MGVEYVILQVGQSNGQPVGDLTQYWALNPALKYQLNIPDPALGIYFGRAVDSIRCLTFYCPETTAAYPGTYPPSPAPASGDPEAKGFLNFSQWCRFLPWTDNEGIRADSPSVWFYFNNLEEEGFRYPNAWSGQLGPLQDHPADPVVGERAFTSGISSDIDLAWRIGNWLGKRINVINLCIPGSRLGSTEQPLLNYQWGWMDLRKHKDWSPASQDSLAVRLSNVLDYAKLAAAAEGNTLKVLVVCVPLGETDANEDNLTASFATNMNTFVDWIRDLIDEKGMSFGASYATPVLWPHITSLWPNHATINAALDQRALDDKFFKTFPADVALISPGDVHWSGTGIYQRGPLWFDAFLEARKGQIIASPDDDVPTCGEIIAHVRMISERNTVTNDQERDVVLHALNLTLRDIFSTVGDTAWWLRQTPRLTLALSATEPVELPRTIRRLLYITPPADPLDRLGFTMIGHSDTGRMRIMMLDQEYGSTEYDLTHIYEPRDMVSDDDRPVLPKEYLEALEVGAARRVVEQSGNATLEQKLLRREALAMAKVVAHANKVDRAKNRRMTGHRGMRPRSLAPRTGYRRREPW